MTMLNLQRQPGLEPDRQPYAEAVSRLASVRHALRLVGELGDGPAPDIEGDGALAEGFAVAGPARQTLFDRKSAMTVSAAAAGLEALLAVRQNGGEPHAEASRAMVDQIRSELEQISRIVLR
ncbi:MAG: hypothetical protein ABIO29_02680 [Sphingomicrobium sp.]